jgi:hypothetical protein
MAIFGSSHSRANTRRVRWPITASKEALTKEEILLCHEFDQAWDHYRQNENLRSQYLGYFFVLAVGSAAFGAQTVRSPTLSSPLGLVLFGVFLLAFALLTGFVYLGVRKSGIALTHYELVWNNIRRHFYSNIDQQSEPYKSLSIRSSDHQALRLRWTRMQSSSEIVILFFSALTVISEFLLCTRLFLIHNAIWPERLLAVGISTLTAAIPILLLVGLGTSFRKSRNN